MWLSVLCVFTLTQKNMRYVKKCVCFFLTEFVLQLRNELFVKPIGKKKKAQLSWIRRKKKKINAYWWPMFKKFSYKKNIDFSSGNKKVKYVEGIDWGWSFVLFFFPHVPKKGHQETNKQKYYGKTPCAYIYLRSKWPSHLIILHRAYLFQNTSPYITISLPCHIIQYLIRNNYKTLINRKRWVAEETT